MEHRFDFIEHGVDRRDPGYKRLDARCGVACARERALELVDRSRQVLCQYALGFVRRHPLSPRLLRRASFETQHRAAGRCAELGKYPNSSLQEHRILRT